MSLCNGDSVSKSLLSSLVHGQDNQVHSDVQLRAVTIHTTSRSTIRLSREEMSENADILLRRFDARHGEQRA